MYSILSPCFELALDLDRTAVLRTGAGQDPRPGVGTISGRQPGSFRCLFSSVSGYHAIIGSHASTIRLPPRRSICSIRTRPLHWLTTRTKQLLPSALPHNYPYLSDLSPVVSPDLGITPLHLKRCHSLCCVRSMSLHNYPRNLIDESLI